MRYKKTAILQTNLYIYILFSPRRDLEFPKLSQMVQSLPGFLDQCLNVCSPSQVLRDVDTEVLEAAHPLHRGPTDQKGCTTGIY